MAPKGYWPNPAEKACFVKCSACFRCSQRGQFAKCGECSGRPDKEGIRDPHPEDVCTCNEGVLRWVTKEGRLIIRRYGRNPFETQSVQTAEKTGDERDWDAYVANQREKYNSPTWDPIDVY